MGVGPPPRHGPRVSRMAVAAVSALSAAAKRRLHFDGRWWHVRLFLFDRHRGPRRPRRPLASNGLREPDFASRQPGVVLCYADCMPNTRDDHTKNTDDDADDVYFDTLLSHRLSNEGGLNLPCLVE